MASADLLEDLRSGKALEYFAIIEGAEATYRLGTVEHQSASGGSYEERIISATDISYEGSRGGRFPAASCDLTVRNDDQWWNKIVAASPEAMRFAPVTIYGTTIPDRPFTDWHVMLTGEIIDWAWRDAHRVEINTKVADRALDSERPRERWKLSKDDWPDIPATSVNLFAPWIWGIYDSSLTTNAGLLPAIRVGSGVYIASAARFGEVTRVWVDDDPKDPGVYNITHPVRHGKLFTTIVFTAGNEPTDTQSVTFDGSGYEDVGDGSGDTIEDPPAQLAHALSQVFFGDYQRGLWLPTSAMIHSSVLAATHWSDYEHSNCIRLSDAGTGYDFIADWLETTYGEIAWGPDGKLHLDVDDPTYNWTTYPTSPYLNPEDRIGPFTVANPRGTRPRTSLLAEYFYDHAQQRYNESLSVGNPTVENDAPGKTKLLFSGAR